LKETSNGQEESSKEEDKEESGKEENDEEESQEESHKEESHKEESQEEKIGQDRNRPPVARKVLRGAPRNEAHHRDALTAWRLAAAGKLRTVKSNGL
jgi:hypothetical protein